MLDIVVKLPTFMGSYKTKCWKTKVIKHLQSKGRRIVGMGDHTSSGMEVGRVNEKLLHGICEVKSSTYEILKYNLY